MENKIKNPVSKKNIFFFNIFDRLINSIEKYVHKTEEDSFAKNFDIVKEDGQIIVSPKGSTVEKLALGNKYSSLKIDDENLNAYIDVTSDDDSIELYVNRNNNYTSFILSKETINLEFGENNAAVSNILFDKNGISVTTNSLDATNANKVLKFVDTTNSLEVTFTVAELIALKALLPTT